MVELSLLISNSTGDELQKRPHFLDDFQNIAILTRLMDLRDNSSGATPDDELPGIFLDLASGLSRAVLFDSSMTI